MPSDHPPDRLASPLPRALRRAAATTEAPQPPDASPAVLLREAVKLLAPLGMAVRTYEVGDRILADLAPEATAVTSRAVADTAAQSASLLWSALSAEDPALAARDLRKVPPLAPAGTLTVRAGSALADAVTTDGTEEEHRRRCMLRALDNVLALFELADEA